MTNPDRMIRRVWNSPPPGWCSVSCGFIKFENQRHRLVFSSRAQQYEHLVLLLDTSINSIRDEYALPVMAQVISSDLVIFGSLNSVTYCTQLSFL